MADTWKAGKRGGRSRAYGGQLGKPRNKTQAYAQVLRHIYGSTEKILRRNRKTWTRLYAKAGRQEDKEQVVEGLDAVEVPQESKAE